ncbi:unnamed protein product [Gongylonema pulchrum]|uniref:Uncharacterized protein n=1 Tax=Gongylonema pulchrum TaxID=637853 RepID=A0A183E838_9BILA|nr:unnamed protein product [Gongylonema pulchrum]
MGPDAEACSLEGSRQQLMTLYFAALNNDGPKWPDLELSAVNSGYAAEWNQNRRRSNATRNIYFRIGSQQQQQQSAILHPGTAAAAKAVLFAKQ